MAMVVRAIKDDEVDELLAFHAMTFGANSYQAQRRYFNWLYTLNPASKGLDDCLVAIDGGRIIGCMHRLRLPCIVDNRSTTLVSLQNHMVSEQARGKGAGMRLLQLSSDGEEVTISSGAHPRLRPAYQRHGYAEIPSFWLTRITQPVQLAFSLGVAKLIRKTSGELALKSALIEGASPKSITVTHNPAEDQLERLQSDLAGESSRISGAYVPWDNTLLRWRYFSPDGPTHFYLEDQTKQARAVVSFGTRRGVKVFRLVEFQPGNVPDFMQNVLRFVRKIGGALGFAFSTRPEFNQHLLNAGWRPRRDPLLSFSKGCGSITFSSAATDWGFESFLTRIES